MNFRVMLRRSNHPSWSMPMPAAKALPQFEAFGSYVDPFGASQTVFSFWLESWRASANAAIWWTEQWFGALSAFAPSVPPAPARPVAAIIDLVQIAAARTAADVGDVAAATVEIVETLAETAASVAEDAVSIGEHAAIVVAAEAPDDLTRLVGIGPKLSIALADRGVTRFAHIAAWTEADLAEVDKALDLKGRAVRDAWIAQAKRFASEA
jgi:predicted flap endonuclease-1-like 5' DNA nuclease